MLLDIGFGALVTGVVLYSAKVIAKNRREIKELKELQQVINGIPEGDLFVAQLVRALGSKEAHATDRVSQQKNPHNAPKISFLKS